MSNVIPLRGKLTVTPQAPAVQPRAVAFYMAYTQLTPDHHPVPTPLGTVYIRSAVTPTASLMEVLSHLESLPGEHFMNGHWVPENGNA